MGRDFKRTTLALCCATVAALVPATLCADSLTINRADYADRLHAMWLGEVLANWTGRMTEGSRRGTDLANKPFYTDADWGTASDVSPWGAHPIGFNFQSPWLTDDDTDVEYAYVNAITQHNGNNPLLGEPLLTQTWRQDCTQALWYSDYEAKKLVDRGASAAATGIAAANVYSHYIDAQLTTEVFGALAPGRPDQGMRYALAPTLMTSRGHATHAAQWFQSLYSLAANVPTNLAPPQKMQWLNAQARQYIPATSKAADIIDFVTADFAANPDVNDWESTRDKIFQRYQQNAAANGFVHRDWVESSVNLATGVMSLLYGGGDYKRTVQIATLSGWDSDNSTASLGGLIGLMRGYDYVASQFTSGERIDRFSMTPVDLSDNFHTVFSGLSNMPDHVPGVANVEDTLSMLSARMLPVIDNAVAQMGGTVNLAQNTWTIPLNAATADKLSLSPTQQITWHSANNMVRGLGGTVTASSSAVGQGSSDAAKLPLIADGFETDFSGREYTPADKDGRWYSTVAPGNSASTEQWLAVTYGMPLWTNSVRLTEGDNLTAAGGSFGDVPLELLVNGVWTAAPTGTSLDEALDPNSPFQLLDFKLPYPLEVTGIRVLGTSGASTFAVSAAELDATRLTPVYWNTGGAGNWDGIIPNFSTDAAAGAPGIRATTDALDVVTFGVAGTYTVNVSGTRTAAQVNFDQGNVTLTGGTLAVGSFHVEAGASGTIASVVSGNGSGGLFKGGAGTLTLASANAYTGGTTVNAGVLVVAHPDALAGGALTIANGATARLQPNLPKAVAITSLTTAGSGHLDVTNNAMVIRGMTLAQVQSAIASGFAGGDWNGPGMNSSTAAANLNGITAIGYASNADLGASAFKGASGLTSTDVFVRFTYYGDADLSGDVTLDDFTQFLDGYQHAGTTWLVGDFDYSGSVTLDDFTQFLYGYQNQGAPLAALEQAIVSTHMLSASERVMMLQAVQAVPEPAALGAAGLFAAVGLGGRRRTRRTA